MPPEDSKEVKVNIETLRSIKEAIFSQSLRIESLIEGHYLRTYRIEETNLTSLMELKISSQILDIFLTDIFEHLPESSTHVSLLAEELDTLAFLSQAIATASSMQIGNINMRLH